MPITPRGTRTWRSSSPFGSREPRTTSPTGSGRATSERSASATPATRAASSRSRSRIASGVPSPAAAAMSSAFAARISSVRSTSASAIASSAASLVSVGRVRSTRAAARARSAATPISGRPETSDTPARVRGRRPGPAVSGDSAPYARMILMNIRTVVLAAASAVALLLTGCGAAGDPAGDSGRLTVVAGFYPLEWAAQRVGGDRVDVSSLTPPGAEAHDLELAPQDVAAVAEADLVVYLNGFQPALDQA